MAFTRMFTFFATRDLAAAKRFYGEILGLQVSVDVGDAVLYRVTDTGFFGITAKPGRTPAPGAAILELVCASRKELNDWHKRVVAAGYAVDGPPRRGERPGVTLFFITGPDGYLVEILHEEPQHQAA
jgi:catechol 2,3-dioxygenase-like lactoylglutathione lyase family enzyme